MSDYNRPPSASAISDALTTGAAAKPLGVTSETVRRWVRNGYIEGYRVGPRNYLVPRSEVERLLAQSGAL
jgi:excisionase family DNA binding protein